MMQLWMHWTEQYFDMTVKPMMMNAVHAAIDSDAAAADNGDCFLSSMTPAAAVAVAAAADTTMAPEVARVVWRHSDNVPVSDYCKADLLLHAADAEAAVADDDSAVAGAVAVAGIVNADVLSARMPANSQHIELQCCRRDG
jgi:hypothetical protein